MSVVVGLATFAPASQQACAFQNAQVLDTAGCETPKRISQRVERPRAGAAQVFEDDAAVRGLRTRS